MKKYVLIALLLGALGFSRSASADFYAGVGLGGSFNDGSVQTDTVKSDFKNSPMYSVFGGYELPLPLLDIRGEIEYLHSRPEVKEGRDRKLDALMVNAIGVIPFVPVIDPYVGIGLGRVRFDHTNSFAVQGILGAEYEIPVLPITVGGEYRYFKINESTGKFHSPSKYHTNVLMLKLKYLF